jgi:hypothetical protein
VETKVKTAIISAVAVVVAAAVPTTVALLSHQSGSAAPGTSATQTTVRPPASVPSSTSLPPMSESTGSPVAPNTSASSQPTQPPILAPQDQAGFTRVGQGPLVIGLSGVTFTPRGVQAGTGSGNEDMGYQGGGNWSNADDVAYWQTSVPPRPGDCLGLINSANQMQLSGAPQVGDRYCAVPYGSAVVAYMQVTAVDADGVHVLYWLWRPNG